MEIVRVGEPVLRQQARPVSADELRSAQVQELIEAMRETMRAAPGVGLAAPQVGVPLQIAVIEDRAELLENVPRERLAARSREPVPFHVIVNPILRLDGDPVEFFEGCLSVPGFSALVPRAFRVRVDCRNERGEPLVIEAHGWYARILQHEIDHLNGTLYIDRMHSRTFSSLENLQRHWETLTTEEVRARLGL